MRTLRTRKLLTSGIALLVLACLWFCFAPPLIGGSTNYVVTDGISMEPRFHSGDLAVVRGQSSYRVGEIVAYHSRALGTVVLHRIVGRAGGRYVFKGDNNNFLDVEHPAESQLIGSLWLHLPGWGTRLHSLRSPALIGGLIAIGTLLLAGAAFAQRRRRRRRQRRADAAARFAPGRAADRAPGFQLVAAGLGLVALLPFLALALAAFTRPSSALLPVRVPYKQSGSLSYSGEATPGPTYAGNRAVTGDPLFTHVLRAVRFSYRYRFEAGAGHSLAGRASMSATIASTSGWHTTIGLGAASYFRGERARANGTLDLRTVAGLLHRVETTTAVSGTYTLTVQPRVSIGGSVGAVPVHTEFASTVPFSLNNLEMRPVLPGSGSGGRPAGDPFGHSTAGTASGKRYQPASMSLGMARMSVSTARGIAIGAIALIALSIVAALTLVRPRRRRDESEAIRARYGSLIVPVARVWLQPGVAVIDVEDFDSLVRIAAHYERSILFELADYGEAFWVTDESGQFRYVAEPAEEEELALYAEPLAAEDHDPLGSQHYSQAPAADSFAAEAPAVHADPVTAVHPSRAPLEAPVHGEPVAYAEPVNYEAPAAYVDPAPYVEPPPYVEPAEEPSAYLEPVAYDEPPVYAEPLVEGGPSGEEQLIASALLPDPQPSQETPGSESVWPSPEVFRTRKAPA